MVKLICSPLHTGKSEYIYSLIEETLKKGKQAILIVPEQEAIIAETALAKRLDGENCARLEVLNFKRLCNRVFREYGGLCYNYINKGGQAVILWRVLSELSSQLKKIKVGKTVDEALVTELLSLFSTFSAYGITEAMLENAQERTKGALKDKLDDIVLIYTQYRMKLSEGYDNSEDDLARLFDLLCSSGFFNGKSVFFDSFYDFTGAELDVIGEIISTADEAYFSIEIDERDNAVNYTRPLSMKKTLMGLAKEKTGELPEIISLFPSDFSVNPEIRYACDNLWAYSAIKYESQNHGIQIYAEGDKYTESQRVASLISKYIRQGCRFREIAVIARSIGDYDGILDTALNSNGIPCHMSKRNRLMIHPALRLVLGALEIIARGYRTEDVITYIKTGYSGICTEDVGIISSYIRLWSIKGKRRFNLEWNMNPKDHTNVFPDNSGEILVRINDIKNRVLEPISALEDGLSSAGNSIDTANAIYGFMLSAGLDGLLNNSEEYIIWNTLCGVLEQYADSAKDACDAENVLRILKMIINTTDIGKIPASIDEVVLGSADMIRLSGIRHIIILGASDSVFPKRITDSSFFTNAESQELSGLGVKLPDNLLMRLNDEKFFFARAISFASETVDVIYSETQSEAVTSLSNLFPDAVIETTDESDFIYTRRDAGLHNMLTEDKTLRKALTQVLGEIPKQNTAETDRTISEKHIEILYPGDLNLTKSRIDCMARCPLLYRLSYELKLNTMTSPDLLVSESGTYLHAIFERSLGQLYSENGKMISQSELEGVVERESAKYIERITAGSDNISPVILAHLKDLTNTAKCIARSMHREFTASSYVPTMFECGIGNGDGYDVSPYAVTLANGRKAYINGISDRVDILKSGDDAYVRIIDYKSGKEAFSDKELEEGKSLQLPLYLFSLTKNENAPLKERLGIKGELLPGGFLYYRIADTNNDAGAESISDIIDSGDSSYIDAFIGRSGISLDYPILRQDFESSIPESKGMRMVSPERFDEYQSKVDTGVTYITDKILGGDASLDPNEKSKKCKYCSFREICKRRKPK